MLVRMLLKNTHPKGKEHSKWAETINLIVDKVTEKTSTPTGSSDVIENLYDTVASKVENHHKLLELQARGQLLRERTLQLEEVRLKAAEEKQC